ncbi:MAG: lycopene cyclase family protein [Gemmatimonadota bacterium]
MQKHVPLAAPGSTPSLDFIVVGAGPAGSRAAELFSRRGADVLLMDPKAPWEKPCGGGLTAAALENTPELRELAPHTQTIEEILVVAPSGASIVIPLRSPYETVSRERLGKWGLDRAQAAGARFRRLGVKTIMREAGGWLVADEHGEIRRCRWLLAADGAASRLRGQLAPDLRPELAPLRVAYPRRGVSSGRAVFQFLSAAEGYLWDFPRPGHHSVGIGVAPGTFSRTDLDHAIDQYRIGEAGDREPAPFSGGVIASSNWMSGDFSDLGGSDYALLGDAGGLADPATGEGIDYAFRSAAIAVDAFDPGSGFSRYPHAVKAAFGAEMRRSRLVRNRLYRPEVAEKLVRSARRSPRAALILMSMVDAVNEHRSLRSAVRRGLFARIPPRHPARAVCECPDGPDPARVGCDDGQATQMAASSM